MKTGAPSRGSETPNGERLDNDGSALESALDTEGIQAPTRSPLSPGSTVLSGSAAGGRRLNDSDSTSSGDVDLEVRAAKRQSLFRDVNENIIELNDAFSQIVERGDWLCECANDACAEHLSMSGEEYRAIRAHPARFCVSPGDEHVFPEVERVVEKKERFWVVEKFGQAGELAARLDPRSQAGQLDPT
jgi:hypothetical protein